MGCDKVANNRGQLPNSTSMRARHTAVITRRSSHTTAVSGGPPALSHLATVAG